MSRFMLTAPVLAIAATAVPASAQDVNWSGFYIGANGAAVDVDSDWTGTNIYQSVDGAEGGFTTSQQVDPIAHQLANTEFGGGGRVGFNFQTGSFVVGAEADATFFGFDRAMTVTKPRATYTVASEASNLQTIRARAGVATGPALIFVTGGVAFSNLKHTLTASNTNQVIIDGGEGGSTIGTTTSNLAAATDTGTGWTVGGGGEFMVSVNV